MMPNCIVRSGTMVVRLVPVVMVRWFIATHLHLVVLHGCNGDRRHLVGKNLVGKTWRGSAAERQCEARSRDAKKIGKGDKPSCLNPNSSC